MSILDIAIGDVAQRALNDGIEMAEAKFRMRQEIVARVAEERGLSMTQACEAIRKDDRNNAFNAAIERVEDPAVYDTLMALRSMLP